MQSLLHERQKLPCKKMSSLSDYPLGYPTSANDRNLSYFEEAAQKNPKYPIAAYCYVEKAVMEAVHAQENTVGKDAFPVSGQFICAALKNQLLRDFGPAYLDVLHSWNIRNTIDFGNIVFTLVDIRCLHADKEDSLKDFAHVFDLETLMPPIPPGSRTPWPSLEG